MVLKVHCYARKLKTHCPANKSLDQVPSVRLLAYSTTMSIVLQDIATHCFVMKLRSSMPICHNVAESIVPIEYTKIIITKDSLDSFPVCHDVVRSCSAATHKSLLCQ